MNITNNLSAAPQLTSDTKVNAPKSETVEIKLIGSAGPQDTTNEKSKDTPSLDSIIKEANNSETISRTGLNFSIDKDLEIPIVKVVDIKSGDVIRQMPNEEALRLHKNMNDISGLLLETTA